MRKYRASQYNIDYIQDNYFVIFNLFTKKGIKIVSTDKEYIEKIIQTPNEFIDEDVFDLLLKEGFVTGDDNYQINILKKRHRSLIFGDEILDINVMPTYDCNFRCIYCFQKRLENTEMTDQVEGRIIKFLSANLKEHKKLYLNWFGGEPLIMKERIIRLNKRIRELCRKNKVTYVARMTTNGYELDVETFKQLFRNNVFIYYVSLDGVKSVHDKQRPHENGDSTYDKIIENLIEIKSQIKSSLFRIDIRVNISKSNLVHMDKFLIKYSELFGDDQRFYLILDKVQEWGEKAASMNKELIEYKKITYWADKARKHGINMGNFVVDTLDTQICQAPKKNGFVIMYDGSIRKCQMAMENELTRDNDLIGYIDKEGSLIKYQDKEKKWVKENLDKKCEKCVALPICLGSKCIYTREFLGESCEKIKDKVTETLLLCDEGNIKNIQTIQMR
ncbi:MAG: radical SAM protein [Alkaliphilus sp.]